MGKPRRKMNRPEHAGPPHAPALRGLAVAIEPLGDDQVRPFGEWLDSELDALVARWKDRAAPSAMRFDGRGNWGR